MRFLRKELCFSLLCAILIVLFITPYPQKSRFQGQETAQSAHFPILAVIFKVVKCARKVFCLFYRLKMGAINTRFFGKIGQKNLSKRRK